MGGAGRNRLLRPRLAEPVAQGVGVDEVGERPLAVDLDDGEQRPVARLEARIAVDRHDLELERRPAAHRLDDGERGLTQVAAGRCVDDDAGYG
jgi:hypothetical protein